MSQIIRFSTLVLLLILSIESVAQKKAKGINKEFCEFNEKWTRESVVPFGWYNARHSFYNGLKYELIDSAAAPYQDLNYLFLLIENEIKVLKLASDTSFYWCHNKLSGKETKLKAKNKASEFDNFINGTRELRNKYRFEFDSICQRHHIKKWLLSEYADSLSPVITSLSDSLMLQGRIIAQQLQLNSTLYPDKKSEGYKNRYQYISEMQAAHKVYGQTLTQLENSQTRFYDANPEEFFYTGPSIGKRREVEATEQVIQKLYVMMNDFRSQLSLIPKE
jgi:hypothetical protein